MNIFFLEFVNINLDIYLSMLLLFTCQTLKIFAHLIVAL